jgi:CubicO group peptidase (beta-lactamase class C family)
MNKTFGYYMKHFASLFFILVAGISLQAQDAAQKIDLLLEAHTNNESFNGTVLVAQKGRIVLQKGYGSKNADKLLLNDGNSIFQVGSITKQFTAAVILKLQEMQLLSIHDKLSKYFPELPFAGKLTIEQLLSHTAGIFNYTNNADFMKLEAVKPATREKLFALFKDKPLEFEPGTRFNYSNSGYLLLGFVIEKITGKPYYQVVHEFIFTPLQMDHSGFNFAGLQSPHKAIGYSTLHGKTSTPAGIVDSSASFAAGAIYSSVTDLYKWDRSLYGEKIISHASLTNAYTRRQGIYGLGWVIDSAHGKEIYQHSGGIFGFTSFIVRSPSEDICIILCDNKGDGGLESIAKGINAILHHQPYELPKQPVIISIDSAILKTYVGQYELSPNFLLTVRFENGQLSLQAPGQDEIPLLPTSANLFYLKLANAELEFVKASDGKIENLILHRSGDHMPAKKIK